MAASRIVPVIMCGGAGTRLWPVSRESMPKQFVPLVGRDSTFQQVLARIADPELFDKPVVITNTDFRFVVAEQLREHGIEADIVLEPMRRDSGPAVAVAALTIYDMVKAVDKEMVIGDVCLVEKKGGRSGHYVRNSKLKTQNSKLLK